MLSRGADVYGSKSRIGLTPYGGTAAMESSREAWRLAFGLYRARDKSKVFSGFSLGDARASPV
jgi:hypothetical protein